MNIGIGVDHKSFKRNLREIFRKKQQNSVCCNFWDGQDICLQITLVSEVNFVLSAAN